MSKIAFIGEGGLARLFECFGIDVFVLKETENAKNILEGLARKDYRIIYILEKFASGALDAIESIKTEGKVSVVVIADHLSYQGLGISAIRQATIDAIGTDAIFAK